MSDSGWFWRRVESINSGWVRASKVLSDGMLCYSILFRSIDCYVHTLLKSILIAPFCAELLCVLPNRCYDSPQQPRRFGYIEMQCAGAASSYAGSVCCFVVNIFPGSGGDAIPVAPVCEEHNACVVNWIGPLILSPSAGVCEWARICLKFTLTYFPLCQSELRVRTHPFAANACVGRSSLSSTSSDANRQHRTISTRSQPHNNFIGQRCI